MALFNLQEGEEIVKEIKPVGGLRLYFFLKGFMGLAVLFLFFGGIFWMGIVGSKETTAEALIIMATILVGLLVIVFLISFIVAHLRYIQRHYWITNKRIVYKKGFIGYSIASIPYERVSDVIVSRSLLERICGFGSVLVQSLAGQISTARMGSEAALQGLNNPEEIQQEIFSLMEKKRKTEKITF